MVLSEVLFNNLVTVHILVKLSVSEIVLGLEDNNRRVPQIIGNLDGGIEDGFDYWLFSLGGEYSVDEFLHGCWNKTIIYMGLLRII